MKAIEKKYIKKSPFFKKIIQKLSHKLANNNPFLFLKKLETMVVKWYDSLGERIRSEVWVNETIVLIWNHEWKYDIMS